MNELKKYEAKVLVLEMSPLTPHLVSTCLYPVLHIFICQQQHNWQSITEWHFKHKVTDSLPFRVNKETKLRSGLGGKNIKIKKV